MSLQEPFIKMPVLPMEYRGESRWRGKQLHSIKNKRHSRLSATHAKETFLWFHRWAHAEKNCTPDKMAFSVGLISWTSPGHSFGGTFVEIRKWYVIGFTDPWISTTPLLHKPGGMKPSSKILLVKKMKAAKLGRESGQPKSRYCPTWKNNQTQWKKI